MILCSVMMRYESMKKKKDNKNTLDPAVDEMNLKDIVSETNDQLGRNCGLDGNLSVVICGVREKQFDLVYALKYKNYTDEAALEWIENHFLENYSIKKVTFENLKEMAVLRGYVMNWDSTISRTGSLK